ncbi:MAG TPA: hypothetical protein VIJ96_19105 [Acidothermaceae bacterium]
MHERRVETTFAAHWGGYFSQPGRVDFDIASANRRAVDRGAWDSDRRRLIGADGLPGRVRERGRSLCIQ